MGDRVEGQINDISSSDISLFPEKYAKIDTSSGPIITFSHENYTIHTKLEGHHSCGSIKGRLVYHTLIQAIEEGRLKKGQTLFELTSGNTGIALGHFGQEYGYKVETILPYGTPESFITQIEHLGVTPLVLPKGASIEQALLDAEEKSHHPDYFWLNQYGKQDVVGAYASLGKELVQALGPVDYLLCAIGTGGTLMGLGKILRESSPTTQLIAVESAKEDPIHGVRNTSFQHLGEKDLYDISFADHTLYVTQREAKDALNALEGLGIIATESTGAALVAAHSLSRSREHNTYLIISADGRVGQEVSKE